MGKKFNPEIATKNIGRALKCGELLTVQKEKLEHGEWIPWIKENLVFNERQAQKYMQLYNQRKEVKELTNANYNSYLQIDATLKKLRGNEIKKESEETKEIIVELNDFGELFVDRRHILTFDKNIEHEHQIGIMRLIQKYFSRNLR